MALLKRTLLAMTVATTAVHSQALTNQTLVPTTSVNNTFGPMDVVYVFAGIMDGILHTDRLDYLLGCMNGTDALVVDVENAVQHFKEGGNIGIGQGIMAIGKFIQDLPPTVYYCGGIPDDFNKLGQFFSIFGNPSLLSQRITYNLLWYYSSINGAIQEAIKDWDQGLYYEFGEEIGDALVLALGDHSTFISQPTAFLA